jgi:hypothetical protein
MVIDAYPNEASSFTESPQNSYLQPEPEDRNQFLGDREPLLEELDDRAIVWRFARGKKRLVVNHDLRIDYAHNSLQLSTPTGELIAIHKVAERLHYILIKRDSKYSELIQNIISECQFIPIDTPTAERGFMRYQKYEIPEGYTLRYEPAEALWQMWQDNLQQLAAGLRLDILILARSKWYRVQQMICTDDRLDLQTRLGLISLSLRDRIAWIAKLEDVPAIDNVDLNDRQNVISGGTDSDILGKIISKLAIETSPNSDLHFNFHTIMPRSVFNEPDDSSPLYGEDRSSTLTAHTLPQVSEQLRAIAIDVLEAYLEHGETIVRTEVITDPQGNVISEKTISTQRGCPRWAIEAIMHWS